MGSIVGPPYAIVGLTPDNGPITGGTLLDIYGIDFINTQDVTVSRHLQLGCVFTGALVLSNGTSVVVV